VFVSRWAPFIHSRDFSKCNARFRSGRLAIVLHSWRRPNTFYGSWMDSYNITRGVVAPSCRIVLNVFVTKLLRFLEITLIWRWQPILEMNLMEREISTWNKFGSTGSDFLQITFFWRLFERLVYIQMSLTRSLKAHNDGRKVFFRSKRLVANKSNLSDSICLKRTHTPVTPYRS
jgi:hypothetical protein